MRPPKSAVVVGGGIAGVSISRLLSQAGLHVRLIEKSAQLCSGATWHAAGLVTRFAGSPKVKKIHVRSLELLTAWEEEYGIGLHTPGSIRIIEKGDTDRIDEAKQHFAMAKIYDDPNYPTSLLTPDEVQELHPLINIDNVELGLWTPHDGDVDPNTLTHCLAKLARSSGTEILYRNEMVGVEKKNGVFHVAVDNGDEKVTYEADIVINAAGLWSRNVSNMINMSDLGAPKDAVVHGVNHPAYVIEHQYVITEEVPQIAQMSKEGKRVPVLRDLAGSAYIRQERTGFLIGPYEDTCVIHKEWPLGPPRSWGMELFGDAVDRISENLMSNMNLVPTIGEVGIASVVNGPTIWTGDSLARVGRTHIPGWYDFNSLTYGIAQSPALAEYLAHIILENEQPWDAAEYFDPLRYSNWVNDDYTFDKITETYTHNNRVVYPFENRPAGRTGVSQYPVHNMLKDLDVTFGFGNGGVEAPAVYKKLGNQKKFHDFEWAAQARHEAQNVLNNVGISYASFSKFKVKGPQSATFLDFITTNKIPKKVGTSRLTYAPTASGKIAAEFTIAKVEDDEFYVVGTRDLAEHDAAHMRTQRAAMGLTEEDVWIEDVSNEVDILHIAGPNSKEMLSQIVPEILEIGFLKMKVLNIDGVVAKVFRVSFSGCQGFEIHLDREHSTKIYELIVDHEASQKFGLEHFGGYALNSLRIEKGFKVRADIDYAHYREAGIEPFVGKKKKFIGRDDSFEPKRRSAIFTVSTDEGWEWSVPSDTPICRRSDNVVVGYTTSSAHGALTGETIAMGYLYEHENVSDDIYLECYGHQWSCTKLDAPPAPVLGRD